MKSDAIKESEATGNQFTTIFLVLGLFSMAAGIILIFMIFGMLAAERKAEMGMTRAIGAQRSQLVQAFIVEGMAYSLLAGLVGVVAVVASLAVIDGLLKIAGGELWTGVGLLLGAYWLLPPAWHERAFGEFQSDIEMFVISGIMVVVSFTLVIVFNASLLTRLFNGAGRGVIGYAVGGAVGSQPSTGWQAGFSWRTGASQ